MQTYIRDHVVFAGHPFNVVRVGSATVVTVGKDRRKFELAPSYQHVPTPIFEEGYIVVDNGGVTWWSAKDFEDVFTMGEPEPDPEVPQEPDAPLSEGSPKIDPELQRQMDIGAGKIKPFSKEARKP